MLATTRDLFLSILGTVWQTGHLWLRSARISDERSQTSCSSKKISPASSSYIEYWLLSRTSRAGVKTGKWKSSQLDTLKEWILSLAQLLFIYISTKRIHFGSWFSYYVSTNSVKFSISCPKAPSAFSVSSSRCLLKFTCQIYMSTFRNTRCQLISMPLTGSSQCSQMICPLIWPQMC